MINIRNPFDGMVLTDSGQKPAMKKVYVVDDEFAVLLSLSRWFNSKGCYVRTFSESKPLFDALYEGLPDVIVMKMHLQKEDGKQVRRQIKTTVSSHVPIVIYAALVHDIKEVEAGYADYFIQQSYIREQVMPMLLNSYA